MLDNILAIKHKQGSVELDKYRQPLHSIVQ